MGTRPIQRTTCAILDIYIVKLFSVCERVAACIQSLVPLNFRTFSSLRFFLVTRLIGAAYIVIRVLTWLNSLRTAAVVAGRAGPSVAGKAGLAVVAMKALQALMLGESI